jgi:thiol-disulfide isomerase/thioredoxin
MGNDRTKSPPPPNQSGPPVFIGLAIVAGIVALLWFQSQRPQDQGPYVGRPLPPLHVAGWLNAAQPLTAADLAGKVVLVDYWATWCGPCVRGIPEVVEFRNRFRDSGVLVIGLTSEGGPQVETVSRFVAAKPGMDWPIGYGAGMTMKMMEISAIPTYMLYDRTGTCVWGGNNLAGAEAAAVRALAKQ